jgi:hypothetical protein
MRLELARPLLCPAAAAKELGESHLALLPTSDFRLQASDFRLQTSDFRLPTSCVKQASTPD